MTEYRGLQSGEPREPTWRDREHLANLRSRGVADVYVEPGAAPDGFWESLVIATHWSLAGTQATDTWEAWEREVRFAHGWPDFARSAATTYEEIIASGIRTAHSMSNRIGVSGADRLAVVEHLLDVVADKWGAGEDHARFVEAVNERARHFRVGLRLEGRRFVPLTSEHMHQEVVRPALLLLQDPRFADSDALYRKAFERAMSGDPAGAVTAATSAVEEMLRAGLSVSGSTLEQLLRKARDAGWTIPATDQIVVKLAALREASDAHEAGTDSFEVAMLAIHLSGAVMRFLADSL